jgi:excisionase family DNA binding protein
MPIQRRFKKPVVLPQPITAGPRLLSIDDAAAYLGARVWAIRQLLRNRQLPYVPVGRGFKIDKVDLDR